jgi:Concanavalin A-like lectin/glucanases superfamily
MYVDKRQVSITVAGCAFLGLVVLGAIVLPERGSGEVRRHGCEIHPATVSRTISNAYNRYVLALGPVLYLSLGRPASGLYRDLSGNGHNGRYEPSSKRPGVARLPNGALAGVFNGLGQYVQVESSRSLSVTDTDCLTVEAWIRPATLQFPREEGSGYAYVLGKGEPGEHEYALRMYSRRNSEVPVRPNRVSAYAFNLSGGKGSGAYFQDRISVGRWLMVAFVIRDLPSPSFPGGYIEIYRNGQLRGRVSLDQFHVRPEAGSAPFRIATRNLGSFFNGAIGDIAVYDSALSNVEIARTYDSMFVKES